MRWWNKIVASKEVIHRAVFREEVRQAHRAQINPGHCVWQLGRSDVPHAGGVGLGAD
jgi:hypothetical protein